VIVRLRQEGKLVATLEVLEPGALVIRMGGKELELSVRDSRRLAGAIVKKSVSGTFGRVARQRLGLDGDD
jgi:hypothetical protein